MEETDPITETGASNVTISILEDYGWYIFGFAILAGYIYSKFKPTINEYLAKRSEREYSAKYHKNPDILVDRLVGQQNRVLSLQEEYERKAEEYKRKMQEKEEKRREEILRNAGGSGSKLGNGSLKPEYNPLMGDSSRSYKPVRKSPCSGGGCGK